MTYASPMYIWHKEGLLLALARRNFGNSGFFANLRLALLFLSEQFLCPSSLSRTMHRIRIVGSL